jgi:hypothetical protein
LNNIFPIFELNNFNYRNSKTNVVIIDANAETNTPAFAGSNPLCLAGSNGTKIELPGVNRG